MLTKVLLWVAPAFPTLVRIALWAVLEGFVTISDIIEEMNLVLLGKKCSTNAMDRCISPALVIESALMIEEIKEF